MPRRPDGKIRRGRCVNRLEKSLVISGMELEGGFQFGEQLTGSPRIRPHHDQPRRHGFQYGQPEGFMRTRRQKNIVLTVQFREHIFTRQKARKVKSLMVDRLEPGSKGSTTCNGHMVRRISQQSRQNLQQQLNSFVSI